MNKKEIQLATLNQRYQIEVMYVFGSRAQEVQDWLKGAIDNLVAGPADVDIGVNPARGTKFDVHAKVRLTLELEELMNVNRVDLVSFTDADPFLAANIIRGERLYARDTHAADEFDLYVLRRAGDLAPFERERLNLILGREV